jgi:DNA-binding CsgD family transcriptional regulator
MFPALLRETAPHIGKGCRMRKETANLARIIETVTDAPSVYDALVSLQEVYNGSFITYHLTATVISELDAPFVQTTYGPEWIARYFLKRYVQIDPIVQQGFLRQLPFDWREFEITPETAVFFDDARQHGVGAYGYSIPITDKAGRRAIFSINMAEPATSWDRFVADNRAEWIEVAYRVHLKAIHEIHDGKDPVPSLSTRERECLSWVARGKDHKDIALILGISEHTARSYLKSGRTKLGCATISSAAIQAMKFRLISI